MDLDVFDLVLLTAFGSLLLELVVFHVSSEASTYQVFTGSPSPGTDPASDPLAYARTRAPWVKIVAYLLPTTLGVLCFVVPLANVFVPTIRENLLPIEGLARPIPRWVGAVFVVGGRCITFSAVIQMRRRQRAGVLQPGGLFRWSRNPGLVGMYLFYLGASLMTPCIVLFAGFVPYVWNMHRRVLMEECHLRRSLGEPYVAYVGSVPRYLGWK